MCLEAQGHESFYGVDTMIASRQAKISFRSRTRTVQPGQSRQLNPRAARLIALRAILLLLADNEIDKD